MSNEATAKNAIRKKELDEMALWQVEGLAFPPTEWEKNTLAEVLALPRVTVTRPPEHHLLAAGMVPNDCHANCSAQAASDPDRLSRHVWGWLISGQIVVLHSVVEMSGQWLCLTPQAMPSPSQFQFIPDPHIEWLETSDGSGRDAFRLGVKVPTALRKYPEYHVRMWDELRVLTASGVAAFDAWELVAAKLGAELRQREPI